MAFTFIYSNTLHQNVQIKIKQEYFLLVFTLTSQAYEEENTQTLMSKIV